jgi:perosamine synthetase
MVTKLEVEFAAKINCQYSLAFTNGTATLHTALEALGIGVGDEVIVPPLTMAATCFSVLQTGALPVFADVDRETGQISASSIQKSISSRTKAIMTVALYGGCPDYQEIIKLAPGVPIIEDNAEAFGCLYYGEHIGNIGIFSSYSLQTSKHLTAGEGGLLCTNDEELANKARRIQSLGYAAVGANKFKISKKDIQHPDYERHVQLGWNYRMSELVAAVTRGQVARSQKLVNLRISYAKKFQEVAKGSRILTPLKNHQGVDSSFWAIPFVLDINRVTWENFRDVYLSQGGKGIYAAWKLNYDEPVFRSLSFMGREKLLTAEQKEYLLSVTCENAEFLQPRLLAFRSNEWNALQQRAQIKALRRTLEILEKGFDF